MMRCDIHSQLSTTYPFAIMMQLDFNYIRGTDRYFAIIIEEGEDLKNLEQNVDTEINFLKKFFGQWYIAPRDLDSRLTANLKKVTVSIDSKSQYTIANM